MSAGRRRRIRADHDCEWRDEAERLRGQVAELKIAVEQIRAGVETTFWSSTPSAISPSGAFFVDYWNGDARYNTVSGMFRARCVR